MQSKYRYVIPNGITFLSLACGTVSILFAATGYLRTAGVLILISYFLDLCDGAAARRLKAGSEFGLQLDSLVDMVSLGTAPAILIFMHLQASGITSIWVWPFVVLVPLAGAFRLARFNLQPAKTSSNVDSMGLTISTGGATLTLAVLADLAVPGEYITDWAFVFLMLIISLLMVSKIAFPPVAWVFSSRRKNLLLLTLFSVSLLITSFFEASFLWMNAYLGVSLARAGFRTLRLALL